MISACVCSWFSQANLILVSISPSARNSLKEFSNVDDDNDVLLLFDDASSITAVLLEDQRILGMSTRTSIV